MKRTSRILLLLSALISLVSCNALEEENGGIESMGPDRLFYRIFISEDVAVRQHQIVFTVGPEGGNLNLIAYYPGAFKTEEGKIKDTLDDVIEVADPDSLVSAMVRTKRSALETAYSFDIDRNTSGKDRTAGIEILDKTGFPKWHYGFVRFVITQKAE